MSRLVSDDMMSAALTWLATSSRECAAARGMKSRREFGRRQIRARLIQESDERSASARESWAECHPDYIAACDAEAEAVEADEFFRCERNKCDAIIETFRTEQASLRAGSNFR